LSTPETPFPASDLGAEQEWWLAALKGAGSQGADDGSDHSEVEARPTTPPASYQSDAAWAPVVHSAAGWLARLHEGVLAAAGGSWADAVRAWQASIAEHDNGWAWRNLAVAAEHDGDHDTAADAYARARVRLPRLLPLAIEASRQLLDAGRASDALSLIASLDPALQADGRIRYLQARAALATGDLDRCERLLDEGIEIADLREGEASLGGLWLDYQTARLAARDGVSVTDALRERAAREFPPPERYDFRMRS
jgi:tetratricopeptide (TPR) repeat protein